MYAVKSTNLQTYPFKSHLIPAGSYTEACETIRREIADFDAAGWYRYEDYDLEIVKVDNDFDFDNQEDFN